MPAPDPPPRRVSIGVFAPTGAGKSTLLVSWYLAREGDGVHLSFPDPDTVGYLRPLADQLVAGHFPPSTPAGAPAPLRFTVEMSEGRTEVELVDYAGELVDVAPTNEYLQRRVIDRLVRCDVVLVLIDPTASDPAFADAAERLFAALAAAPSAHGVATRPLGLVATKGDTIGGDPDTVRDADWHRVLLDWADPPAYRWLTRRLDQAGIGYEVFVTSAVGPEFRSAGRLRPLNALLPLRWAVAAGAGAVAAAHAAAVAAADGPDPGWVRVPGSPLAARARRRRLETARDRYRLDDGPDAARVLERIAACRAAERRGWAYSFAATVALVLVCGATWTAARADGRRRDFDRYDLVVREHPGPAGAAVRARAFDVDVAGGGRTWDEWMGLGARRGAAEAQSQDDRAVVDADDRAWAVVTSLPEDTPENCRRKADRLAAYAAGPTAFHRDEATSARQGVQRSHEAAVRRREAEADAREWDRLAAMPRDTVARYRALEAELAAYSAAQTATRRDDAPSLLATARRECDDATWDRLARMPHDTVADYEAKAVAYAEYRVWPGAGRRNEVDAVLDAARRECDDHAWRAAASVPAIDGAGCARKAAAFEAYARWPHSARTAEAARIARRLRAGAAYAELAAEHRACCDRADPAAFRRLKDLCDRYLTSADHDRHHRAAVAAVQERLTAIPAGGPTATAVSVTVPPDSRLYAAAAELSFARVRVPPGLDVEAKKAGVGAEVRRTEIGPVEYRTPLNRAAPLDGSVELAVEVVYVRDVRTRAVQKMPTKVVTVPFLKATGAAGWSAPDGLYTVRFTCPALDLAPLPPFGDP